MHPRGQEDARLVAASRAGDPGAFPALFEHWFDPCVDVAWRILRDRDAAADVAQETFLAAWRGLGDLRDPSAFGGWVLRTARNRALNRLSRERRSVASGQDEVSAVLDADVPDDEPGAAAARDENAELVWAASAALGERDASVLDLHLRHGLAVPEIAEAMGVSSNNAHQMLFRLRKRLSGAIRAWVLWRDGDPACPLLFAAIEAGGVTRFGPEAVRVISRHVPECDDCDARQQLRLAPEALFAAIPVVPAGAALRSRASAALQAEGVPVAPPGAGGAGAPEPGRETGPEPEKAGGEAGRGSGGAEEATASQTSAETTPTSGKGKTPKQVAGLVGAAVALLLLLGSALIYAMSGGDDEPVEAVGSTGTTTTTGPGDASARRSATPDDGAGGGPAPTAPAASSPTTQPAGDPPDGGPTGGGPVEGAPTPGDQGAADPTTTSSTTTAPPEPPPPPADPPVVVRFSANEVQPTRLCPSQRQVALTWHTEGATGATLSGPGAPAGQQPASGQATACVTAPPPTTFTLTATGPGGSASATDTA